MKIQDLIFIAIFSLVIWRRNYRLALGLGLGCLVLAIPLFKFWIFFTAERLTWYAAAFILLALGLKLLKQSRTNRPTSHAK